MRQEMRQLLTPRMIQSMEILQLPLMALEERIEEELQNNPVLEMRETDAEPGEDPAQFVIGEVAYIEDGTLFNSDFMNGLSVPAAKRAVGERLERGEKTVLFVNRRGSAGFILCRACGNVSVCRRCSVSLTAHRAEGLLRCHQCDAQMPIPTVCPKCQGGPIREFGIGTQRVVESVQTLWPRARVVRMDSDTTTRGGDHARLLDDYAARGDILVGTQMIAKGLDFPTVTLVGVIAADIGLHVPEFRAAERTFDLITQVAGRSGRARAGEAIVQTYSPEHPAIQFAARHDFDGFAAYELEQRRELNYPPFGELIYLGIFGRRRPAALDAAQRYAVLLRERPNVEVLGPAPFAIARANQEWRFRVALKTNEGAALRAYLREAIVPLARADRHTRLAINVDP